MRAGWFPRSNGCRSGLYRNAWLASLMGHGSYSRCAKRSRSSRFVRQPAITALCGITERRLPGAQLKRAAPPGNVGNRIRGATTAAAACGSPSPALDHPCHTPPLQYDLSVSTFSPDGRVFQTDYAQKAVDNSGCAPAVLGGLLAWWLLPNSAPCPPCLAAPWSAYDARTGWSWWVLFQHLRPATVALPVVSQHHPCASRGNLAQRSPSRCRARRSW